MSNFIKIVKNYLGHISFGSIFPLDVPYWRAIEGSTDPHYIQIYEVIFRKWILSSVQVLYKKYLPNLNFEEPTLIFDKSNFNETILEN